MLNLLNEVNSTIVGIISLGLILITLAFFIVLNIRKKQRSLLISCLILVVSLISAIFLAKPLTFMFDKMFTYSTAFVNMFMKSFGQIEIMNTTVTNVNYSLVVSNFRDSEVGLSSTVKNFLLKVFDNTKIPNEKSTSLSLIASNTFSYLFSLFITAFVVFVILEAVLTLVTNLLLNKTTFYAKDRKNIIVGILTGIIKGFVACLLVIITVSSLPLINTQTDYVLNGFEATKVMEKPYKVILLAEQNIYLDSADFQYAVNKVSGDTTKVQNGVYTAKKLKDDYNVTITVVGSNMTILIKDNLSGEIVENAKILYNSGKIYAIDNSTQKCIHIFKYNEKNKSMYINISISINGKNGIYYGNIYLNA